LARYVSFSIWNSFGTGSDYNKHLLELSKVLHDQKNNFVVDSTFGVSYTPILALSYSSSGSILTASTNSNRLSNYFLWFLCILVYPI